MRVSHYFEWESQITGGHAQSVENQRTVLDRLGIEYTTSPTIDADVLHLNNMGPRSLYYAKRARRAGVPVLIHTHQTAEDMRDSFRFFNALSRVAKPYLSYAYNHADHLICPSEYNREVIAEYSDVPTTVISNGFDPRKIEGHDDPDLRQRYLDRYDIDPPVVFMVGHVIERKGLRTFIETARALPDTDFVWFGYLNPGGGTVDRLLRRRSTTKLVNGAPENCTFTGYVDDIAGAYAAGDIFCWPTRNENEGMALLEAMACGAAPVIRDLPIYDWLEDDRECLKARDEFASKIERLLDDQHERDRIGRNAADKASEFTLDAISPKLEHVYERLVDAQA